MKIKPFKILGNVLKVAAVPVATAVAGPTGGAVVAAALGSGKGAKEITKKVQKKTGSDKEAQNIVAPATSIAVGAVLSHYIAPDLVTKACAAAASFCEHPDIGALAVGLLIWISHQFGSNVQNVAPSEKASK